MYTHEECGVGKMTYGYFIQIFANIILLYTSRHFIQFLAKPFPNSKEGLWVGKCDFYV